MPVDKFTGKAPAITAKISAHYVDNARELPWRVPPALSRHGKRADPYHVWLSEIMLQQTTVAAVKSYFDAFTNRWPTLCDLAEAAEADVLSAWAGLGYYARARNLHKCARQVVEKQDGQFPYKESELLKLPGVGAYTAAAIAAIAFGERAVVVDANIERLMARLWAIGTPLPKGKSEIRSAMDAHTPNQGAGDFAQACMDIGATICTAKKPKCEICPLQNDCRAFAQGKEEDYPVKPPKKAKPVRKGRFFWIEADDHLLLIKRPAKGMLGSMRALPDDRWAARQDGDQSPPIAGDWDIHSNVVQHSFTHFSLEVDLAIYKDAKIGINGAIKNDAGGDADARPDVEGNAYDGGDTLVANPLWWPLEDIKAAGLPTLFAKAVQWKLKER